MTSKDQISLSMEVEVERALDNSRLIPFPVSSNSLLYYSDQILVHGILGCDLTLLLGVMELCLIKEGSLLRLSYGYMLFGDVSSIASAAPSTLAYLGAVRPPR